ARVPRAAVGRVSRGLVASRLGCATGVRAARAGQRGLLRLLVHGYVDAVSGLHDIAARIEAGSRIDTPEAAAPWRHASDEELQRLAGLVRARYHEPDRATYMVMRIINYTNVCVAQCDYCAFYVLPNQDGGYVLSRDDVFAKIDELLEVGGDLVGF